ncbi:hypothetical protein ENH_00065980, partial [Eimeria necatrix]
GGGGPPRLLRRSGGPKGQLEEGERRKAREKAAGARGAAWEAVARGCSGRGRAAAAAAAPPRAQTRLRSKKEKEKNAKTKASRGGQPRLPRGRAAPPGSERGWRRSFHGAPAASSASFELISRETRENAGEGAAAGGERAASGGGEEGRQSRDQLARAAAAAATAAAATAPLPCCAAATGNSSASDETETSPAALQTRQTLNLETAFLRFPSQV